MILTKQYYWSELGVGTDYVSLLPRELTIDPNFVATRFSERQNTLFKEVRVVPAREIVTPEMRRVFKAVPERQETKEQLFGHVKAAVLNAVYNNWDTSRDHVIMHSSGIDSRIMSWAIRELWKEFGDYWLGNTVFVCSQLEEGEFKNIMRYEGWRPEQYMVANEGLPRQEYYKDSLLDFDNAWRRCGVSAIPVNLFWYLPEAAIDAGLVGNDIQLFTGQWGNTVFDSGSGPEAGEGVRKIYKMFYWSVLFQRPMMGQVVHVFTDEPLVHLVATSKVRLGKKFRPEFLEFLDPKLAKYTNINSDGDRHQKIADWIIEKMIADYDSSWYGKTIAPGARPAHKTTEFQTWYSRWTSASLCKHLLQNGYTIRKG